MLADRAVYKTILFFTGFSGMQAHERLRRLPPRQQREDVAPTGRGQLTLGETR